MFVKSQSRLPERQPDPPVSLLTAKVQAPAPQLHALDSDSILNALPVGVFLFEVRDQSFRCLLANEYFASLAGLPAGQMFGADPDDIPLIAQSAVFLSHFRVCQSLSEPVTFEFSGQGDHLLHDFICVLTPTLDAAGRVSQILGTVNDRTSEKNAQAKIRHSLLHDPLTALPNRELFSDRVEHALAVRKPESGRHVAIIHLNVDRFQVINESLGHVAGDEFLIALAVRLKSCVRSKDTLCRLNGDEFAILLENATGLNDVTMVTDRIHDRMRKSFNLSGEEIFATVSLGIATTMGRSVHAEDIMRDADLAMHRAKALGKNRSEVYHHEMHTRARSQLKLESDLRRAIGADQLRLHYQPIVCLRSRRLVGFEALARWQHPERGMVHPGDFIGLAEETGLILPIGRWAIDEACRQLAEWRRVYPSSRQMRCAVNVSGIQLVRDNMVDVVTGSLKAHNVPGSALKLELTESVLMENADRVETILRDLRQHDVGLAIDDFGTGYSSLAYLGRFPIDTLKIDRSFVSKIELSEDNKRIIEIISMLAATLGMSVVAEGIETQGQLQVLDDLGCEYGQGYLFAKPMPADEATTLIEQEKVWARSPGFNG